MCRCSKALSRGDFREFKNDRRKDTKTPKTSLIHLHTRGCFDRQKNQLISFSFFLKTTKSTSYAKLNRILGIGKNSFFFVFCLHSRSVNEEVAKEVLDNFQHQ
jgi:hypothetical protein